MTTRGLDGIPHQGTHGSPDMVMDDGIILKRHIEQATTLVPVKAGLVATMPRSGTWYNHMFFSFYNQLLEGKTVLSITGEGVPLSLVDVDLGRDHLFVCHTACPGFDRYEGPERAAWEQLNYYTDGYDWARDLIQDFIHMLDPALNPQVRIVYCSRNPLDQVISFFQHMQGFADKRYGFYREPNGRCRKLRDERDFLFHGGLESYIKQYLTYRVMKSAFPDNILMIHYEQLVRDAKRVFSRILEFFGHDINRIDRLEKIDLALQLSSKESARRLEKTMGHSLAFDLSDPEKSHIKDGAIGKWKKYFNDQDLKEVQKRLADFGICLDEFQFE